jgi:hypothetical protein
VEEVEEEVHQEFHDNKKKTAGIQAYARSEASGHTPTIYRKRYSSLGDKVAAIVTESLKQT